MVMSSLWKRRFLATALVSIMMLQFATLVSTGKAWTTEKLDVEMEVGVIHFRGETAEFYVPASER